MVSYSADLQDVRAMEPADFCNNTPTSFYDLMPFTRVHLKIVFQTCSINERVIFKN